MLLLKNPHFLSYCYETFVKMSVQCINSDGKISAWLGKNCGIFINSILFFWVDVFLDLVTVWPVPKYMYSYSDCPPTYLPIHPYSSNIIKKSFQFYPAVSTIMISWIFSIIKWMLHLFQFSKNWRRKMTFSDKIHLLFTKYGKCKLYI